MWLSPHCHAFLGFCNGDFVRWCARNDIPQLALETETPRTPIVIAEDDVLDFCFGSYGIDDDLRYIRTRCRAEDNFLAHLLEVGLSSSNRIYRRT